MTNFRDLRPSIYAQIAATGRFEGEVHYSRQNGERFWAKDHGRTIVLGERPEAYTVFSVIDITEEKRQQELLTRRKEELEATLARVKRLEGIISICMYCKKIRNEQESWEQLEKYITENSDALFSHGICPTAMPDHCGIKSDPEHRQPPTPPSHHAPCHRTHPHNYPGNSRSTGSAFTALPTGRGSTKTACGWRKGLGRSRRL